jgi:hypothetical protein
MDLVGGISALSEALKLTKELRSIDREIDKTELKLRLVDVVDRLLEAKEALQDAKQERQDLLVQIEELRRKLSERAKLMDDEGLLFEISDDGKPTGEPYCNQCYVKDDKLFRLVPSQWNNAIRYDCSNCKFTHLPGRGKRR